MSCTRVLIFAFGVHFMLACSPEPPQPTDMLNGKSAGGPAEIFVASGAGYRKPIDEIKFLFEKKTAIAVNCIYGNMRQITTQAKTSGKVAVIIGDVKFLNKMDISFKKETAIGIGRLVIAARKNLPLNGIDDLTKSEFDRIIVPDSKKAIYGRAAFEAMTKRNIYKQIQPRLITVQTVPQVTSYLAGGTAQAGFMNRADFLSLNPNKFKAIDIDRSLYESIIIEAALTEHATDAAEQYMRFLQSDAAKGVFDRFGLGLE
ncbi:MAG: molybdate ABC transporter substrate-binding protein [Deltaproteobacteria bacterium]|nr:molybdate ABC transporter substrate-binding protein [Deltaproteobacteria bacterium]